jgi:hypothetical protein
MTCGDLKGPLYHNNYENSEQILGICAGCQNKGYYLEDSKCKYSNYQKWTI